MTVDLTLPLDRDSVLGLKVGDLVRLTGEIVITAGIPTHKRIVDCLESGKPTPIDLRGAAFFHLGSYSVEEEDGAFRVLYMNPTTSTRFNDVMPRLIRGYGLRAVGGKGGLDRACADAMAEVGCVYLSFLGGGAPIHSDAIRRVVDVAWNDLIAHYRLVRLAVEALGPLTVAIDARGNSVYDDLKAQALGRRDAILSRMRAVREAGA